MTARRIELPGSLVRRALIDEVQIGLVQRIGRGVIVLTPLLRPFPALVLRVAILIPQRAAAVVPIRRFVKLVELVGHRGSR